MPVIATLIFGGVMVLVAFLYVRSLRDVHFCAGAGWVDELDVILDEHPERISARDALGETPLHKAARYGELEAIRLLVERGADVAAREKVGGTPLHLAAVFGHARAVTRLVELGADMEAKDDSGCTPLAMAVMGGYEDVVAALERAGADTTTPPAFLRLETGDLSTLLTPDDPLMRAATKRAQASMPTLRALFPSSPEDAYVGFWFRTDKGREEHLWGEVLSLTDTSVELRVKTPPVTHSGAFEKVRSAPIAEISDWQFEQRDGRLRGGFSLQAVYHRLKQRLGKLPPDLATHEGRFVDDALASMLVEAGESRG